MRRKVLSRRTLLRGLGAGLALPHLEAMIPTARAEEEHPKRVVFFYYPNGMLPSLYRPTGQGTDWQLSPIMEPLAAVKDDILPISGLTNLDWRERIETENPHGNLAATILTGDYIFDGIASGPNAGRSADQLLAEAIGDQTRFPSLVLTSERGAPCPLAAPCEYFWHISWKGPDQPIPTEGNPAVLFQRLFGALPGSTGDLAARLSRRRRVLDFVLDDAKRLQRQLGRADRARLDAWLTGIHELEGRLFDPNNGAFCADELGLSQPANPRAPERHVDAMCDLMIQALQCDQTRIISYMLANAASRRVYTHLGLDLGHHTYTHPFGPEWKTEALLAVSRWQMEVAARFVQRLKEATQADGTSLYDHTTVVFFSSMGYPDDHEHTNLPVILAGRGGGLVTPGHHLVADGEPFESLLLALLENMGAPRRRFGRRGDRALTGL